MKKETFSLCICIGILIIIIGAFINYYRLDIMFAVLRASPSSWTISKNSSVLAVVKHIGCLMNAGGISFIVLISIFKLRSINK